MTSSLALLDPTDGLKRTHPSECIVLPHEDRGEVSRRFDGLEAELRPNSGLARHLVGRITLMTLRLDRSAVHEAKETSHKMRHAMEKFEEARLAEVDHLMSWIASEPATNTRRLRKMPEGIERLIAAIAGLRADLARVGGYRWDYDHSERLHHLLGIRSTDLPVSRVRALTDAIAGNFLHLDATDGPGLEGDARRVWAIGELVYFMDAEIERLKGLLDAFDHEGLERDRAEAAARAMFDDSKEAILARKYEAASERAMYRALRELRELQAETANQPAVTAELGSSLTEPVVEEDKSGKIDVNEPGVASTVSDRVETRPDKTRPRLDGRGRKGRRSKAT